MEVPASSAVLVGADWLVVMSAAAVGQVALVAFVVVQLAGGVVVEAERAPDFVLQAGGVVVEAERAPVFVEENLHAERRLT